jgi:hypothetical protein
MPAAGKLAMAKVGKRSVARNGKKAPAAPKLAASELPPHPQPRDPEHAEWTIDEAEDESFPASDPSSISQPHRRPAKKNV